VPTNHQRRDYPLLVAQCFVIGALNPQPQLSICPVLGDKFLNNCFWISAAAGDAQLVK
jgi:hypothetical protein